MNAKHTPTPWKIVNPYKSVTMQDAPYKHCAFGNGDCLFECYGDQKEFNASHIVHCVNLHDELVECLRRLRMHCTDKYDAKQIDDLLLKAKGE